jgi:hypothetical protein
VKPVGGGGGGEGRQGRAGRATGADGFTYRVFAPLHTNKSIFNRELSIELDIEYLYHRAILMDVLISTI